MDLIEAKTFVLSLCAEVFGKVKKIIVRFIKNLLILVILPANTLGIYKFSTHLNGFEEIIAYYYYMTADKFNIDVRQPEIAI